MLNIDFLRKCLKAIVLTCGIYYVIWGGLSLFFPGVFEKWILSTEFINLLSWELAGIISIILGFSLLWVSTDPFRQWIVVAAAFFFQVIMSLGFIVSYVKGLVGGDLFPIVFTNWIVWILPFSLILYLIYRRSYDSDNLLIEAFSGEDFTLDMFESTDGRNLMEMSNKKPILLVFLRHFGCPFCKDTLEEVSKNRAFMESEGAEIVLIYMVSPEEAAPYISEYGLKGIAQLSDPESILYKKFALRKGTFWQLFGPKTWVRALFLAIFKGKVLTRQSGDVYQMPGIFMVSKGNIINSYVHNSASDSPPFQEIVSSSRLIQNSEVTQS